MHFMALKKSSKRSVKPPPPPPPRVIRVLDLNELGLSIFAKNVI